MKKKYILEGLDCANCAIKIETELNKLDFIKEANVSYANLLCVIDYRHYSSENEEAAIQCIISIEEDVKVIKKTTKNKDHETCEHSHQEEHACCKEHEHECKGEQHDECCCGHHHVENEHQQDQHKTEGKQKFVIKGLDCANCALKIEDAVNGLDVVKSASLNFVNETLLFDLNENVDQVKALETIKQTILSVEEVEIYEEQPKKKEAFVFNEKHIQIGLGVLFLVVAIILDSVPIYLLSYVCIGYSVLRKAVLNIFKGKIFDENFLMSIATIGALIVKDYAEAVVVMLFYQVGEAFQEHAVARSRKSIAELMNLKSDVAHLIKEDTEIDVDPEEIAVDDIILVKPGERIPLDGIIVEGKSSVDTSALTGESLPVDIDIDSEVLAGCINLSGMIKVRISKVLSESTVSRILDLVENASSKKAVTEQRMTKFARVYTPIVVVAALAVAIIPNFMNTGIGWNEWLIRACTFLVISCPCALVLSIPLGYFAGIGAASKKGILIKGGNYLEILSEIDSVVFDKTGTLTTGTFSVQKVVSEYEKECLEMAAHAESYSTHPIALSIQKAYGSEVDKNRIESIEEIAGEGIKATIDSSTVLVGNKRLMEHYEIKAEEINSIGTLVYVAKDNQYLGVIEISDSLKPTTKEALIGLKQNKIKRLIMLTGDRMITANQIGKELGLDEVHAQLLPDDKVNEIEKILANTSNGKVAYVGDGINDAPVLARCDLGVAMGGLGSEAAIEAADIVLMKDDINSLNEGIHIARKTQQIMTQNISFILLVKSIVLVLSLFGYANMWLGVFADVGVSLLAVINAMRILKI